MRHTTISASQAYPLSFFAASAAGLFLACLSDSTPALAQGAKAATPLPPVTAPAPEVTGVWIDHTGRGAIEIMPCGTRLCGYVYWVKELVTKQGQPVVDANNPDPKHRNKPICGTQILIDLAQEKPARLGYIWGGGSIYDPERGEKFDAEIKLASANELTVLGYLGLKFMGESFTWKRAPADLVRCGPPRI